MACVLSHFDPVDCSLPGSSIHGIFLERVLEWVAISFSRASSQLRDRTQVSYIGRLDSFLLSHLGGPKIFVNWLYHSLVAQTVKCLSTTWETRVQSLGQEDLLEKETATHSSIPALPQKRGSKKYGLPWWLRW